MSNIFMEYFWINCVIRIEKNNKVLHDEIFLIK